MKLMQYFKIYDNELCPCGSGKNYIECCKNRKDKPVKKSKKPLNIQIMEQFRKSQIKCCLYPDSKRCVKHIKEAHALQNNKIISQLSEDGHVYILNPNKQLQVIPIENEEPEIITLIDRVGVNHATTATCFCDVHDDEVFAPIEKGAPAFNKDSDEHKYLYAYKAFIFEYYKKLVEQKILKENITKTPSLLKTPQYVQFYRAISMTLEEMNKVKKFFDNGIVNKDYNGLETCVIEIPESIKFATYSCIAIDFDLFGKRIRHTKRGFISRLFITIFPEETKSYILLSCLREDVKVYKKFFQQLQTTNLEKVKYYFDLILPLYTENNVLSPRLWENWSEEQQICYNKSHVNNYLEQKRIHNLDRSSYVYVKGDFEPIITEEQWEKCNRILNSKRKNTLVQNGETVKKSNRISTDLWVQKLRCVCGSSFRKNRYHKDKDGNITYNYVCYNQVNNGKATEHKDGDGFCNEASITQWKMDMMAELLLQSVWQSKRKELLETLDSICDYYKAASKQNCSESVILIENQIDKVEERKKSLITMFADGNITRDEFVVMKAEYTEEIKKLCEQREHQSKQESIMNGCISEISAVAKQLGRMLESSSPVFQKGRLNEHIRSVVADNRKYTWNVTINPSEDNKYSTAEPDEDCAVIRLGEGASILSHPHRRLLRTNIIS